MSRLGASFQPPTIKSPNGFAIGKYLAAIDQTNVRLFNGVPDWNGTTGTNNFAMFVAALASFPHDAGANRDSRAGKLIIPKGRYYMGNGRVKIDKCVMIEGEGAGFWEYASGVELVFAAGGGVDFRDSTLTPTGTSAAGSVLRGVTLYCKDQAVGTPGVGLFTSTLISVEHVKIEGFTDDNLQVSAEAPNGNASNCVFHDVLLDAPAKNNLHVIGADANVITFSQVRCSNAGVGYWNILDDSTIGNVYENTLTQGQGGSYKTTKLTAFHLFLNAYTEGGLAEIAKGLVLGGTLSNSGRLAANCGAIVIGTEGINRRALPINVSATRAVAGDIPIIGYLGDDANPPGQTGTVFAFGAVEEGDGSHRLKYDAIAKWWGNQYANSSAGYSHRWPGGTAGAPYHGLLFENGYYLGTTAALQQMTFGAAMPTAGARRQGDYHENTAKAILGSAGSRYVVKGWNRITTSANHVLNTDWTEDRAPTGT